MPALEYRDVLDRYQNAQDAGETRSLPEYSQHLNDIYDTHDFDAGLQDSWWKRSSTVADQYLENNGVGQVTGAVGGAVGSMFGQGEAGERVGRQLPRSLLDTAPLYLAGPEAGLPATAVALLGTGGLMAAHTYADTGSSKAALISGVTGAMLPGVGHLGGALGARALGGSNVAGELGTSVFRGILPETAADVGRVETGRVLGSQLAQFGANEASMYAMHKTLSPDTPFDPLSADFLLQQIPFTIHDLYHAATAEHPTAEGIRPLLTQPGETKPPAYVPPSPTEEETSTIEAALANVQDVTTRPDATPEEKSAALDMAAKSIMDPDTVAAVKKEVTESPKAEDMALTAHANNVDDVGDNYYRVRVDQYNGDQQIPDHRTVFVKNITPTRDIDGNYVFQGPDNKDTIKAAINELPDRRPVIDLNQPDLPVQTGPEGGELESHGGPLLQGPTETPPELKAPDINGMLDMGLKPEQTLKLVNTIPKSGDLILDSFQGPIQQDATGNVTRLGNTSVAADGLMHETRFTKATGLTSDMVAAMKESYPEAFSGGTVNATKLVQAMKARPMVEVRKLKGATGTSESLRLLHELDTRYPGWNGPQNPHQGDPSFEALLKSQRDTSTRERTEHMRSSSMYSFLGPKSEKDMPGYTEILVRVPRGQVKGKPAGWRETAGRSLDDIDAEESTRQGIKYHGPHFGSEDTNVLSFLRGYEETLPDGRKAFHVIEVQSDWAQAARKELEKNAQIQGERGDDWLNTNNAPFSPLLRGYETLALKAAIQHAKEIGADAVILSDAETAMMTEGHDKAAQDAGVQIINGERVNIPVIGKLREPPQSAGMRLHYDTTLPDAMSKLTGQKGDRVEVGQHKMAEGTRRDTEGIGQDTPNGSPVFREPSGEPKTSISGRIYPLDKINAGLSANDTLSLKEAVAKYEQAKQKETQARLEVKQEIVDAKQIP